MGHNKEFDKVNMYCIPVLVYIIQDDSTKIAPVDNRPKNGKINF